jgi:hypothetical protein
MIPDDIKLSYLQLEETNDHSIVIITGIDIRHERFALRILQEFGGLVKAWYICDPTTPFRTIVKTESIKPSYNRKTFTEVWRIYKNKVLPYIKREGLLHSISRAYKEFLKRTLNKPVKDLDSEVSSAIFQMEINEMRKLTKTNPIRIHPTEINTEYFINKIGEIDPYFLLTLGGPLYKKDLLESIKGICINQHAGHSPEYKGSYTTYWPIYHRNLNMLASTVHILNTGADNGPILRRSLPNIIKSDDLKAMFNRVVALGTEMMIEVVQDIINDKKVKVFYQNQNIGKTYLSKEYTNRISNRTRKDVKKNWIREELESFKEW